MIYLVEKYSLVALVNEIQKGLRLLAMCVNNEPIPNLLKQNLVIKKKRLYLPILKDITTAKRQINTLKEIRLEDMKFIDLNLYFQNDLQ